MKEKIRTISLVVIAVCAVVVTFVAVNLMNNLNTKVNSLYTQADDALTTLNKVATDIDQADLPGMADQIKSLTDDAIDGVGTTMDKIDSIDMDALNDSIERLDEATSAFEATVNGLNSIFGR